MTKVRVRTETSNNKSSVNTMEKVVFFDVSILLLSVVLCIKEGVCF